MSSDVEEPDLRGRFPEPCVPQAGPDGGSSPRLLRGSASPLGLHLLHRLSEDPLRDRPRVLILPDQWAE